MTRENNSAPRVPRFTETPTHRRTGLPKHGFTETQVTCRVAGFKLPGCRVACRLSSLRTLGKYELLPGCRLAGRQTHTHTKKNISGSSAQFLPPQRTSSARGLRPYDLTTLRPYDLTTLRPYDLHHHPSRTAPVRVWYGLVNASPRPELTPP
jgi:hypothetical protein